MAADQEFNDINTSSEIAKSLGTEMFVSPRVDLGAEFSDPTSPRLWKRVSGVLVSLAATAMTILNTVSAATPAIKSTSVEASELTLHYSFTIRYKKETAVFVECQGKELASYTCPWDASVPSEAGLKALTFSGDYAGEKGSYVFAIYAQFGFGKTSLYQTRGILEA
jgi:hypothetical protein